MSKKAFVWTSIYAVPLVLFIFLLLFIYMALIVIPTYQLSPEKSSIVGQDSVNYDLLLLNFLKTPVEINGEHVTISDLIRNPGNEDGIRERATNILDYYFEDKAYNLKARYYTGISNNFDSEIIYIQKIQNSNSNNIIISNVTIPGIEIYNQNSGSDRSSSYYEIILEVEK